jgi:hypothetical protein
MKGLEEARKCFELLRNEVGDFKPEAFNYLENRFCERFKTENTFRKWCNEEIRSGNNPAKKWLKLHYYPIDETMKKILQLFSELTEESKNDFLILLRRCVLLSHNSSINTSAWLSKHFNPVFKSKNLRP